MFYFGSKKACNIIFLRFDEKYTMNKSKGLKISYDWRGMPIEFIQQQQPAGSSDKNLFKLTMSYDGSGRRISKTRWVKNAGSQDWEKVITTKFGKRNEIIVTGRLHLTDKYPYVYFILPEQCKSVSRTHFWLDKF